MRKPRRLRRGGCHNDRHGHWPDESPEICAECRIDAGKIDHDCDETSADGVILSPGTECRFCGFVAPTDDETPLPEEIDADSLVYALDRLALGFESGDPHIRHEAKMVAKQNIAQIAREAAGREVCTDGGDPSTDGLPNHWSTALGRAIRSEGHTVELVPAESHGIQVEIDGVPVLSESMSYPTEQFEFVTGRDYIDHLTDDGVRKIAEVNDGE